MWLLNSIHCQIWSLLRLASISSSISVLNPGEKVYRSLAPWGPSGTLACILGDFWTWHKTYLDFRYLGLTAFILKCQLYCRNSSCHIHFFFVSAGIFVGLLSVNDYFLSCQIIPHCYSTGHFKHPHEITATPICSQDWVLIVCPLFENREQPH